MRLCSLRYVRRLETIDDIAYSTCSSKPAQHSLSVAGRPSCRGIPIGKVLGSARRREMTRGQLGSYRSQTGRFQRSKIRARGPCQKSKLPKGTTAFFAGGSHGGL